MEKNLNIKLILLFTVAFWLISEGGEMLGYLVNPALAEKLSNKDFQIDNPEELQESAVSIVKLTLAAAFAGWIALVLPLVVALMIGKKKRWHWSNGVVAVVLVYAGGWMAMQPFIGFFNFLHWPGEQFGGILYFVVNGLVLIGLGAIILLITALTIPPAKPEQSYIAPQIP